MKMCETDFYKFKKALQNHSIDKQNFIKEWEYIGSKLFIDDIETPFNDLKKKIFLNHNLKKYKIKFLPIKKKFICEHKDTKQHEKYYIRNFFNEIILITGFVCCKKIGIDTTDYNICRRCKEKNNNNSLLCTNCKHNCIKCKILKSSENDFCDFCLKERTYVQEIRSQKKLKNSS
jgi:hypothetical protein